MPLVDVLASGAIYLGSNVVCDGFVFDRPYRIQTHIHEDHMNNFDKSKGLQDIFMSPETYALLVAERNADLEYRDNLFQIDRAKKHNLDDGSSLSLIPSNHMLGSCQVELELPSGQRIGYSGDFGWPLDRIIQVEQLVVDSTYGSPSSVRKYTQDLAEERLLKVILERLRYGTVHVKAHPGTVERVLHILGGNIDVPILASDRLIREVEVYQSHGFAIAELVALDSDAGAHALGQKSYVRLYSKGDGFRNELIDGTSVTCSAFMINDDDPLKQFSERSYSVALSNHADFNETLDYIKATGASMVVTDNTRNHGVELAIAITDRLGVTAKPSSNAEISG